MITGWDVPCARTSRLRLGPCTRMDTISTVSGRRSRTSTIGPPRSRHETGKRNLKLDESGDLKAEIPKSEIGPAIQKAGSSNLSFCNFGFEMPGFVQFQNHRFCPFVVS